MNPLVELCAYGQSFWYDNIRRKFLQDGTIQRLITEDGLRGMTSNPTIFEKAIGESDDYNAQLVELLAGGSTKDIYESLALTDIQAACDLFAPLYQASQRGDGYVSLEVSPDLAHDSAGTIIEAHRLFAAVHRPNVMIKVPATPAGIPVIRELISAGINVNITLMFSMSHYLKVAQAYTQGIQQLIANGGDPRKVASVASFFVSRVDSLIDKKLAAMDTQAATDLMGKAGIANSKNVYQTFKHIFYSPAFDELRHKGANIQRLLWASTSTKNPTYPDTIYVDGLIGADTVNTMPPATVDAFRDHGKLSYSLESGLEESQLVLKRLAELGIDLEKVGKQLQEEGVASFAKSFASLMNTIASKAAKMQGDR